MNNGEAKGETENNPSKITLFWILRKLQIENKNLAWKFHLINKQTTKLWWFYSFSVSLSNNKIFTINKKVIPQHSNCFIKVETCLVHLMFVTLGCKS